MRPVINARGTLTIIGGSMELPEVRAAKAAANQHYVNLEELTGAAGNRLAERAGNALHYRFTGELSGDTMSGTLDMGEYRSATWSARLVGSA